MDQADNFLSLGDRGCASKAGREAGQGGESQDEASEQVTVSVSC